MLRLARVRVLLVAAAASLACSTAEAQQAPDVATAETLFEQGRRLMAAGNHREACEKFAESERLAPAAGTALNLATCFEKQGKLASAWGMFREAVSLSVTSGQKEREQYARGRAAELEPRLSKLVVEVTQDEPGLQILRDGIPMTSAQWRTPLPVDPGVHIIEATAPRKQRWTKNIEIRSDGVTETVKVPVLSDAALDPPPPRPAPTRGAEPSATGDGGLTLRAVGFVTMALGAGLAGTGGVFAWQAATKKDELEQAARGGEAWTADRQAAYEDGENATTLANVFFISGGVAFGAGAALTVLGFSAKKKDSAAARLTPRLGGVAWTF